MDNNNGLADPQYLVQPATSSMYLSRKEKPGDWGNSPQSNT